MKCRKEEIYSRVHKIPEIRFEDQQITSFAGLVIIQALFSRLRFKDRLRTCFDHLKASPIFGHHVIAMILMVHLIIGCRRLRDMDYYRDDPMVRRLLGLNRLPDVATVPRALATVDRESVEKIRQLCRAMVIERVRAFRLWRLTLDFDGSVCWTTSQLDLFIPRENGHTFKVMVTNKPIWAKTVLAFHHGRGNQEGYFSELKPQCQMDYIPIRRLHGNQLYLMAGVLAHNVIRELQMIARPPDRGTTEKRSLLWIFEELATLRNRLLQRAGRLTVPQKKLTLTMNANKAVQKDLLLFLEVLQKAA